MTHQILRYQKYKKLSIFEFCIIKEVMAFNQKELHSEEKKSKKRPKNNPSCRKRLFFDLFTISDAFRNAEERGPYKDFEKIVTSLKIDDIKKTKNKYNKTLLTTLLSKKDRDDNLCLKIDYLIKLLGECKDEYDIQLFKEYKGYKIDRFIRGINNEYVSLEKFENYAKEIDDLNFNTNTPYGNTPLMIILRKSGFNNARLGKLEVLLKNGAKMQYKNFKGRNAFDILENKSQKTQYAVNLLIHKYE